MLKPFKNWNNFMGALAKNIFKKLAHNASGINEVLKKGDNRTTVCMKDNCSNLAQSLIKGIKPPFLKFTFIFLLCGALVFRAWGSVFFISFFKEGRF